VAGARAGERAAGEREAARAWGGEAEGLAAAMRVVQMARATAVLSVSSPRVEAVGGEGKEATARRVQEVGEG